MTVQGRGEDGEAARRGVADEGLSGVWGNVSNMRIADCGLRIADCGLRIVDCGLRITP